MFFKTFHLWVYEETHLAFGTPLECTSDFWTPFECRLKTLGTSYLTFLNPIFCPNFQSGTRSTHAAITLNYSSKLATASLATPLSFLSQTKYEIMLSFKEILVQNIIRLVVLKPTFQLFNYQDFINNLRRFCEI